MEQAQHCLGRAIFLKPQEGHTKYLSLAQLMTGKLLIIQTLIFLCTHLFLFRRVFCLINSWDL